MTTTKPVTRRPVNPKRVALGILVIEVLLAAVAAYLWWWAATRPTGAAVLPEFYSRVGSSIGAFMGAVLGVGIVLYFVARRNWKLNR